jgi:AraC-like DNA-binding protein
LKPLLIDRSSSPNKSFTIRNHRFPNFLKVWHHHPELELVVIIKSNGTRFIGDNIEQFCEGEVLLIGKNLPHMWLNDNLYFEKDSILEAEAIVIHFKEDFTGKDFLKMPEMGAIAKLLERSSLGIKFSGDLSWFINQIKNIHELNEFDRTMKFIQLLNFLANHKEQRQLSSIGFINSFKKTDRKNLDRVYEYIIKNFKNNIRRSDVAEIANMDPSAFSRFFKRINRKTFTEYLNEVRIGYACKLLIENKSNISEICYESGFNNLSNFNRQFKKAKNCSPTDYSRLHSTM